MKKVYRREVVEGLKRTGLIKTSLLTEKDIANLPPIVKKYLRYAGVVGKEKLINVRIKFEGKIRSNPTDKWMTFNSEQYNFFDVPTRIFYIEAKKMGIPVKGIHLYKDEKAIMVIKLAGLFKIVDAKGPEMDQGETVTVLNDMCCMAPASLIDENISWEVIDDLTVKATYINGRLKVRAKLLFSENGALINFVSNDRFETSDGKIYKNYPWFTPITEYKNLNGIMVASSASTIFQRPDSDFCYGEFLLKEIEYNCKEFKH